MSAYAPSGRDVVQECREAFNEFRFGRINKAEFQRRLDAVSFGVDEGRSRQPRLFQEPNHDQRVSAR
jgi:hypothetical protein